jgi:flagellar motor switch protein FliG
MYTVGDRLKSGTSAVAQILNEAEISVERHILGIIKERDPQMADEIKQQMFLFEDIVHFNDRTVQTIINEMEKSDLVMGLKGVDEEVKNKFVENMSERAAGMLQEDMDALGPVPLKEVKEAQQRIIRNSKELEEEGQITTRKMSEEEIVE